MFWNPKNKPFMDMATNLTGEKTWETKLNKNLTYTDQRLDLQQPLSQEFTTSIKSVCTNASNLTMCLEMSLKRKRAETKMTHRSMRNHNVRLVRNLGPFFSQRFRFSWQIECPVTELWLPRTSINWNTLDWRFRIFQIRHIVLQELSRISKCCFHLSLMKSKTTAISIIFSIKR